VNDFVNSLLTAIHQVDWLLRDLIAAFAIMCETSLFVGLIIPGDTIVLVAATGVQNIFDFFGLLGFVVLGSLIGESVGFWIGRAFGPRIRASKLGQRIGENNWMIADEFVETRGGWAIGSGHRRHDPHALSHLHPLDRWRLYRLGCRLCGAGMVGTRHLRSLPEQPEVGRLHLCRASGGHFGFGEPGQEAP
jgi:hypothetical protein